MGVRSEGGACTHDCAIVDFLVMDMLYSNTSQMGQCQLSQLHRDVYKTTFEVGCP